MLRYIFSSLFYLFAITVFAQPTPAAPQSKPIVIMGATAHLGNGQVVENSVVAFENGKFTLINTVAVGQGFDGYQIIEANGKHLYPGFIAANTQIGLQEIGAVRATRDGQELGRINPSIRSIIAYNTDSQVTPTVRTNGVLMAQIVPAGGRISGQSSIVELDAWNWEDAAYKMDEGIRLNWPPFFRRSGSWFTGFGPMEKNKKYDQSVREIEDFFTQAAAYAKKAKPEVTNLKFEAMRGLFDKTKQLYIYTNDAKNIQIAVLFAKRFDLRPIIVGGQESWMITDFLKEHKVAILLKQTQDLPRREDSAIDQTFKTAKALQDAGVLYAFTIDGVWQQRNLCFQAGQSVAFGLDYENAISALTLNPAKILNIDQSVGSIETGKDATFFISEGDVLDMRTCKVTHAFIRGKEIDLDNKQKALYRKFTKKYQK